MFALLFEVLAIEIQKEIHHFLGWSGIVSQFCTRNFKRDFRRDLNIFSQRESAGVATLNTSFSDKMAVTLLPTVLYLIARIAEGMAQTIAQVAEVPHVSGTNDQNGVKTTMLAWLLTCFLFCLSSSSRPRGGWMTLGAKEEDQPFLRGFPAMPSSEGEVRERQNQGS